MFVVRGYVGQVLPPAYFPDYFQATPHPAERILEYANQEFADADGEIGYLNIYGLEQVPVTVISTGQNTQGFVRVTDVMADYWAHVDPSKIPNALIDRALPPDEALALKRQRILARLTAEERAILGV